MVGFHAWKDIGWVDVIDMNTKGHRREVHAMTGLLCLGALRHRDRDAVWRPDGRLRNILLQHLLGRPWTRPTEMAMSIMDESNRQSSRR
jgi:hypothetical protein